MSTLQNINDKILMENLLGLIGKERKLLGEFLLHLNEVARRRLHLSRGWPSVFKYLVGEFNFSEPTAAKRLAAARMVERFPESLEFLVSGRIHLSGVYLVARHLTEENSRVVLETCSGKSKAWIEDYVARRFIVGVAAPKRDVVRVISSEAQIRNPEVKVPSDLFSKPVIESKPTVESNKDQAIILPISEVKSVPDLVRISTTVDRKTLDNLKRLQEILGANELGEVIAKAAENYLKKLDPLEIPKRAKKPAVASNKRFIPKSLKHAVHVESNSQCVFIGKDGRRCTERKGLHIDHVLPLALGGLTERSNLRLLCPAHNQFMARKMFGGKFMDRFTSPYMVQPPGAR